MKCKKCRHPMKRVRKGPNQFVYVCTNCGNEVK